MGKGIPADQEGSSGGFQEQSSHHSSSRSGSAGRKRRIPEEVNLSGKFLQTVRRVMPDFSTYLQTFPDPRVPERTIYSRQILIGSAILMFALGLRSRRQFRFESTTPAFVANLNRLSDSRVETAPHDDTIVYYLERADPTHCETLPSRIVHRLVRMKTLDRYRVHGSFLVAIDGTGMLFFRQRHCEHCLTRTLASGQVLYFHHVLEAKLVTSDGYAFSLATEFIENIDPHASKQDCELKAFTRLAEKLKSSFPQLPMILLGDALYANGPVFDRCRKNGWHFIFTFKEGSLPKLFREFTVLKDLCPRNRTEHRNGQILQHFAWINDLVYQNHRLSAFECRETRPDGEHYFAWITDLNVGCASVVTLANQAGRLRWKIENEGFNIQKNSGYELEHAYSENENASKNLYFLLQVAHALNQLMIKGGLLGDFVRNFGSIRNYLRRLAESLRMVRIEEEPDGRDDLDVIEAHDTS